MIGLVLSLIGILICVYCSGFFSGSEIAFTSCNEVRMRNEAEDGNRRAGRVVRMPGAGGAPDREGQRPDRKGQTDDRK